MYHKYKYHNTCEELPRQSGTSRCTTNGCTGVTTSSSNKLCPGCSERELACERCGEKILYQVVSQAMFDAVKSGMQHLGMSFDDASVIDSKYDDNYSQDASISLAVPLPTLQAWGRRLGLSLPQRLYINIYYLFTNPNSIPDWWPTSNRLSDGSPSDYFVNNVANHVESYLQAAGQIGAKVSVEEYDTNYEKTAVFEVALPKNVFDREDMFRDMRIFVERSEPKWLGINIKHDADALYKAKLDKVEALKQQLRAAERDLEVYANWLSKTFEAQLTAALNQSGLGQPSEVKEDERFGKNGPQLIIKAAKPVADFLMLKSLPGITSIDADPNGLNSGSPIK